MNTIIDRFPYPSLLKHLIKPDYAGICNTHCLLMVNVELIKFPLGGIQNGYLGFVLTYTQYALVSAIPFIHP